MNCDHTKNEGTYDTSARNSLLKKTQTKTKNTLLRASHNTPKYKNWFRKECMQANLSRLMFGWSRHEVSFSFFFIFIIHSFYRLLILSCSGQERKNNNVKHRGSRNERSGEERKGEERRLRWHVSMKSGRHTLTNDVMVVGEETDMISCCRFDVLDRTYPNHSLFLFLFSPSRVLTYFWVTMLHWSTTNPPLDHLISSHFHSLTLISSLPTPSLIIVMSLRLFSRVGTQSLKYHFEILIDSLIYNQSGNR